MTYTYSEDEKLRLTLRRLRYSNMPAGCYHLVRKFAGEQAIIGLAPATIHKYLCDLGVMTKILRKDYRDADKEDIFRLIAAIDEMPLKPRTKQSYRISIRKFWTWLNDGVQPSFIRQIRVKSIPKRIPRNVLVEDDIVKLLGACRTAREAAFIFVLWESGCRIGEMLSLRIGDVSLGDKPCIIVDGKTGPRRIRLIESVDVLLRWLDEHPERHAPAQSVWLYDYNQVRSMIGRLAKESGIDKHVHPHAFRHSRATYLARTLNDQALREVFGWCDGRMVAVYSHLAGRDIDEQLERIAEERGLFKVVRALKATSATATVEEKTEEEARL